MDVRLFGSHFEREYEGFRVRMAVVERGGKKKDEYRCARKFNGGELSVDWWGRSNRGP